jgi:hypothetical protein
MGWYFITKTLAGDDILKMESILNLDFQSVINFLVILKQERRVEKLKRELNDGKVHLG